MLLQVFTALVARTEQPDSDIRHLHGPYTGYVTLFEFEYVPGGAIMVPIPKCCLQERVLGL